MLHFLYLLLIHQEDAFEKQVVELLHITAQTDLEIKLLI